MNVPQFDNDQDNAQPEHHDGFIDTGSFPVYASGPAPVDGYGHLNRPTNSQQDAGSDQDGNQPTGRNLDPKKGEVRDSAAGHWLEYKGPNSNEWCKFPCYIRSDSPVLRFCSCRCSSRHHSGPAASGVRSVSCPIWRLRYALSTCDF